LYFIAVFRIFFWHLCGLRASQEILQAATKTVPG
jgi:hypothetical protein